MHVPGRPQSAGNGLYRSDLDFRRLLERLPSAAYMCDTQGLITYFNGCNRTRYRVTKAKIAVILGEYAPSCGLRRRSGQLEEPLMNRGAAEKRDGAYPYRW